MRNIFFTLFCILPILTYSQDFITFRNGNQIECKITKVDSLVVYYDFYKGDRKLSSYVAKNDISSFELYEKLNTQEKSLNGDPIEDKAIYIDTTKYVKETHDWINMIMYSRKYGIHATGWSVMYYGYALKNTSKWSIPLIIGIDISNISNDYFSQSDYQAATMSYSIAGISPFYHLGKNFFLNLGLNFICGQEQLIDHYGSEYSYTFFGISPSQGIYYVPKSKVGIAVGISIFEKSLSSKVYKNDFGIKLDIGLKF